MHETGINTLKDFKNAKNDNYYFLHQEHTLPSLTDKTDGNNTLLLSIPNPGVLQTLATTSYALLVFDVLHVASPRINEANYFIISHVACKYT